MRRQLHHWICIFYDHPFLNCWPPWAHVLYHIWDSGSDVHPTFICLFTIQLLVESDDSYILFINTFFTVKPFQSNQIVHIRIVAPAPYIPPPPNLARNGADIAVETCSVFFLFPFKLQNGKIFVLPPWSHMHISACIFHVRVSQSRHAMLLATWSSL